MSQPHPQPQKPTLTTGRRSLHGVDDEDTSNMSTLDKFINDIIAIREEIAWLKEELHVKEGEVGGLHQKLQAKQAELDGVILVVTDTQAKLNATQAKLDVTNVQLDATQAKLVKTKAKLDEANAENMDLNKEARAFEHMLNEFWNPERKRAAKKLRQTMRLREEAKEATKDSKKQKEGGAQKKAD